MRNDKKLGSFKVLFLVSGILNLLTAVSWVLITVLATVTFTALGCGGFLITLICAAACTFDFICYNRLSKMNRTGTYKTIRIAAILDICVIFTLNITSVVFGMVILAKLNNPDTMQELMQNGIY
ncbi:MAG TPA: hypothetical protein PKE39_04540 [Ignavibacteria bacterium]|nr:hypothetical protein [Ignavibacteria bacterium]